MSRQGQLYQRDPGRGQPWFFAVDVNPPGAPRRQTRQGPFKTKREAQEALSAELVRQQTGQSVAPDRITFGEYLIQWLEAQDLRLVPSTVASYRRQVESYVLARPIAHVRLQSLDAVQLDLLYAELRRSGARNGDGLSYATIRNVHGMLHKACRDAVKKKILLFNPVAGADAPSKKQAQGETPETAVWDAATLSRFLVRASSEELWHPSFRLAAMTGCRRGEVYGAQWGDVDFDASTLTVNRNLQPLNGKLIFSSPKTRDSRRTIRLDTQTTNVLKAHRARQAEIRLLMGPGWAGLDLLFCRTNGSPLNPNNAGTAFQRLIARWGLPRIRFHDLRHTHATLLLKRGVPLKVVSERLGHSSPAFTIDRYQHVLPGMHEKAAQDFADEIAVLSGLV